VDLAITTSGEVVPARRAIKYVQYFCIKCGSNVTLAKGEKNRPHFRHPSAKKRTEVLQCEDYVSSFFSNESFRIYENELRTRSHVRLELCNENGVWKLYMRFPIIKHEFHSLIDREHLYFQVRCLEEDFEFSSVHLLGLQGAYKIPIRIREKYTISVSEPEIENLLQLNLSGVYCPFESDILLFKNLQGCILHVPYQNVVLSESFFILAKKPLRFPNNIDQIITHVIGDFHLYECHLTNISSSIIEWFSQELKIQFLIPKFHVDILEPNIFRHTHGLIETIDESIKLMISFNGPSPKVNWISVIDPDGRRTVFKTSDQIINLHLKKLGIYIVYLINLRGEMIEVKRVSDIKNENQRPLILDIDDQQLIFNKLIMKNQHIKLTTNLPVVLYQEKNIPIKINASINRVLDKVERIHVPFLWSVKWMYQTKKPIEIVMPLILRNLKQSSKYQDIYIGARRYKFLCEIIENTSFPQKNYILVMLYQRPCFIPTKILGILRKVGIIS